MKSSELYTALGGEIRALRTKASITQEKLAIALGLSRPSVANIEGGRQVVAVHQLVTIASQLNTSPQTLLDRTLRRLNQLNTKKNVLGDEKKLDLSPGERKILEKVISNARMRNIAMHEGE